MIKASTPIQFVSFQTPLIELKNTNFILSEQSPTETIETQKSTSNQIKESTESPVLSYLKKHVYDFIMITLSIVIIIILMITCQRKKIDYKETGLPQDIKLYLEKSDSTILFCMDRENEPDFPCEIYESSSISEKNISKHIAVSWTNLKNLYEGIVKRRRRRSVLNHLYDQLYWKEEKDPSGLSRYHPGIPIRLFSGYMSMKLNDPEPYVSLCSRSCLLTNVLMNPRHSVRIMEWEEESYFFKQKYQLVFDESCDSHIAFQCNLPELFIYDHYSYSIYHQFENHPFHEKRNQAVKCQQEYNNISFQEIHESNYLNKLIRIKPISDKNQRATRFIEDIEHITKGLETMTPIHKKEVA